MSKCFFLLRTNDGRQCVEPIPFYHGAPRFCFELQQPTLSTQPSQYDRLAECNDEEPVRFHFRLQHFQRRDLSTGWWSNFAFQTTDFVWKIFFALQKSWRKIISAQKHDGASKIYFSKKCRCEITVSNQS